MNLFRVEYSVQRRRHRAHCVMRHSAQLSEGAGVKKQQLDLQENNYDNKYRTF